MYRAANIGDLELLKSHIQNGVNPNYQHPEIHATPLVTSICLGHEAVALFLIEHGADPYLVSLSENMNAFEAAEKYERSEVLRALKQKFTRKDESILFKISRQIQGLFKKGP